MYRSLLRFVQIAIVLVVLPRVASFVASLGNNGPGVDLHDIIAVAFAIVLGVGTFGSAYFSDNSVAPEYPDDPTSRREELRRIRERAYYATMLQAEPYARRSMILFAVLDGMFNLADALTGAAAAGRLTLVSDVGTLEGWLLNTPVIVYGIAVVLFGLSPTILSIYLARLNSMVDRIPTDYERPKNHREIDWGRTLLGALGIDERRASNNQAQNAPKAPQGSTRASPQKELVYKAMDHLSAELGRPPTFTEVMELLGERAPSKSTVSKYRNEYLNQ